MKVLEEGHIYRVRFLDGEPSMTDDRIVFVERVGPKYPGNRLAHPGTTSQEVLRVLIDRARYVNGQIPCWQTRLSKFLMGLMIWLYEHRAAKRHGRKAPTFHDATFGQTCGTCGHVGCGGSCHPCLPHLQTQ